jgi:hypothetical protein
VCTAAGVGCLDLLRRAGLLDFGPPVSGALPLQRLAGSDAQPFARMAVAWVVVGVVAGLAMRAIGVRSRVWRGAAVALVAFAVLVVAGAVSDAVTASSGVGSHVAAQFRQAGTFVAVALMVIGSLLVARRSRNERRDSA